MRARTPDRMPPRRQAEAQWQQRADFLADFAALADQHGLTSWDVAELLDELVEIVPSASQQKRGGK